jgi:hypothetical protein
MQNTLYLTLKKPQFEVTLSGEKRIEYRRSSQWITSRLLSKNYDLIRFVNGYGKDKPYFIVEFKGYEIMKKHEHHLFSNGLEVEVKIGHYAITLGKVVETGNL